MCVNICHYVVDIISGDVHEHFSLYVVNMIISGLHEHLLKIQQHFWNVHSRYMVMMQSIKCNIKIKVLFFLLFLQEGHKWASLIW